MAINVMIVDDSMAVRKILKRMLSQGELAVGEIHEAGDGAEALDKLKGQSVHLILSDINMPNMDGIQFLTELKANHEYKRIPVVMISTEAGQGKVMEAVQLGASGYVRKPFTPEQIKAKLSELF